MPRLPPDTLTSDATNPVAASEVTKSIVIALSFVVSPLETSGDEKVIVGAVLSYVQLKVEEAAFLFNAASLKLFAPTEIEVAPSAAGVKVAL